MEQVKVDFFKRTCNKELFERIKVNKQGQKIEYLRSTSDLDTGELSLAIDRFRNWSAAKAGIYLPSAGEKEFLIHVQQQIEKNKEFI